MLPNRVGQQDWSAVKNEIQKTWSGLQPEDLEKTRGDIAALTNLVERKCGVSHDEAESKLDEVIARCGTAASSDGFDYGKSSSASGMPSSSQDRTEDLNS